MRSMIKLFPLVILFTVGCASTQFSQVEQADTSSSFNNTAIGESNAERIKAEDATSELPNVSLTAELLNDLILADVAARRGHLDVSVKLHLQLAHYTRDPRLAERATRIANYADMSAEALEAASLWVEVDPANVEARQLLTALLVKGGESSSALEHLERILETEGESANGFMVVAGLLSRERDTRVALDLMNQLVEKRSDNADAFFALSHLALRLSEYGEAEVAVKRTLVLRPSWEAASLQFARVLVAQGKISQAFEYLDGLLAKQPEVLEYRLFYARLLMEQERLPDAYEQFKAISVRQPNNEDALFALGFIGLQLNQLDEAEIYLLRLKKLETRGYEVNYYLGRLEEMRGNREAAQQWYGSIAQGEHYVNAQIRIIALTSEAGDLTKALVLVQELKRQRPAQKLRLDLVEGEVLAGHEKYQEAMELYSKALLEVPENADLLYARSMVAEKLGDLETLERDLRQILARDPNNVEALNALGYSLSDRTTRYEEAYELISRAIELRPNDYYILDSMGWVKYRLGEHEEALKYLRRALDLKMDEEIAAHLGEVLWVTGDREGAKAVWQRALERGTPAKNKIITEVMERLDR